MRSVRFFELDYSFRTGIPRSQQLVLCGHLSLWSTLFTLTARKKFLVGPIDMFEASNLFYMIREINARQIMIARRLHQKRRNDFGTIQIVA